MKPAPRSRIAQPPQETYDRADRDERDEPAPFAHEIGPADEDASQQGQLRFRVFELCDDFRDDVCQQHEHAAGAADEQNEWIEQGA
jgi:hypothetical protein